MKTTGKDDWEHHWECVQNATIYKGFHVVLCGLCGFYMGLIVGFNGSEWDLLGFNGMLMQFMD